MESATTSANHPPVRALKEAGGGHGILRNHPTPEIANYLNHWPVRGYLKRRHLAAIRFTGWGALTVVGVGIASAKGIRQGGTGGNLRPSVEG